ncbi:MAG: transporter substrate-binding domain-containing protein [Clostridia bacterium]|nr:transporter substrate-binding domain-containing protein [Clostridia bacterium]
MKKLVVLMLVLVLGLTCVLSSGCGEKLVGFDIEMAEAVGEILDIKIEFTEINWDLKVDLINGNQIDVVWNGFTYTKDRDDGYYDEENQKQIGGLDFTEFYMENRQVAVVKKSDVANYTSNASFAGKRGVAEATSAGETVIIEVLGSTPAAAAAQLDIFTAVQAGTYDYGVLDATMASEYIVSENGGYHDSLAVVELEGVEKEYYAVAVKEDSNAKAVLNYAIAKLYESGKAQEIAKKYACEGVLYNGFADIDTANFTLPTDGEWARIKNKGTMVIGYTIFAPMAYMA